MQNHGFHKPQFPDEPDFLGLTEEEANNLADERGLVLRLIVEGRTGIVHMNIDPGRVTAEVEGGVIVYAQRF